MKTYRFILVCICVLSITSNLTSSCVEFDRNAFDRTVTYYSQSGDSLKHKAAEFLRDNSRWHYGVPRYWADSLGTKTIDIDYSLFSTDTAFVDYLTSNGYQFMEQNIRIPDNEAVTDSFLRNNIELAFDSWQRPWAKGVGFDDFCRYILPYRSTDEELSDWRKYFKSRYEPSILDSVAVPSSIRDVTLYLIGRLKKDFAYSQPMGRLYGGRFMSHDQALLTHYLECGELANLATLALRACGIPCATIETFWRFNEVSHLSVMIPATGTNPSPFRISIYDELLEMGEPKDSMASYRTWMYSYEPNPNLVELSQIHEPDSSYYTPVCRQDITPVFSKTYNISLPVTDEMRGHSHGYLCRFSRWQWKPIRDGRVGTDSVHFENATIRQWYRLGVMDGDSIRTFGHTFTVLGPQVADSVKGCVADTYTIKEYDCTGDTVLYKMVYNCKPNETRLTRDITTYYWNSDDCWHEVSQDAVLWGLNEKTGEYKVFDESMRGIFKPVFHLLQVRLPKWTVFFDNEIPRPLGFICPDPVSGEGYFMQF